MSVERWTARLERTSSVALLYTVVAVVMTWPVARYLGTRLASDVHDPAFNSWVLAWTTGQMLQVLGGDLAGVTNFWNANIFYPEPLTLAYSEHLAGQALQVLPIQAATGNILLAYNLLFISTFALSGLAVYVLVRDLTDRSLAAFLAGLAFAYAPYRFGQVSHLQVLSSYWMPFALAGFHRYFTRLSAGAPAAATARGLVGGAIATVVQNLSCGYYMLFFAPFVVAYCLYEIVQRRLAGRWMVWAHLAAAALFIAVLTWPFASGYFQLRQVADLGVRSESDLVQFSADTHAFTAPPRSLRVWSSWLGDPMGYRKPEGAGFPGITILTFAAIGLVWGVRRVLADLRWASLPDVSAVAIGISSVALVASTGVVLWFFANGPTTISWGAKVTRYSDITEVLTTALVALAVTATLVSTARRRHAVPSRSAFGFFAIATMAAALLAFGPEIQAMGRRISVGPYLWLFESVPGFDGLRVPARYLMLVTLFLAVLAGFGAAAVLAFQGPVAKTVVALALAGILAEGWVVPMSMNAGGRPRQGFNGPPPPAAGRAVPPIYEFLRTFPDPIAVLELPFGDPAYEMMAVFYAGHHRRPISNGYSGWFPQSYRQNLSALRDVLATPDRAVRALGRSQASHVLVHEAAWPDDRGRQVSDWLLSIGAQTVTVLGSDRLLKLPSIARQPE